MARGGQQGERTSRRLLVKGLDKRCNSIDYRYMNRVAIALLRLLLVLMFMGAVGGQVLIPLMAAGFGQRYWEVSPLVVPFALAGVLGVLGFQVALVAIWRLLTLVKNGDVFSRRARTWVNVIIVAGGVAAAIGAGAGAYLTLAVQIGGPMVVLLFLGSLAGGAAFVLLMLVMRGLLDSATADRDELAEVI